MYSWPPHIPQAKVRVRVTVTVRVRVTLRVRVRVRLRVRVVVGADAQVVVRVLLVGDRHVRVVAEALEIPVHTDTASVLPPGVDDRVRVG